MKARVVAAAAALAAAASSAFGSVTITIDRLDPSDGGQQPPPGIVVVDVLVDVSDHDVWTTGGFTGAAQNGARFLYAYDPNNPAYPVVIRPGTQDRFVSFVSKPRPRDADSRFNSGGAGIASEYCGEASPEANLFEFDLAWLANPPATIGSPSVDGAVLRVALDARAVCRGYDAQVILGTQMPPDLLPILRSDCHWGNSLGTVMSTYFVPTPTGSDWGIVVPIDAPECPVDLDRDGAIDLRDLTLMLASFGLCQSQLGFRCDADVNRNLCVDAADLAELLAAFGDVCP